MRRRCVLAPSLDLRGRLLRYNLSYSLSHHEAPRKVSKCALLSYQQNFFDLSQRKQCNTNIIYIYSSLPRRNHNGTSHHISGQVSICILFILFCGVFVFIDSISSLILVHCLSQIQNVISHHFRCSPLSISDSTSQAVPCLNASPWVLNKVYKPGDRVSSYDHLGVHNNIYECNGYPWNEVCGQAGFQPGQDEIGPGPPQNEPKPSWKIAWTLVGPCTYTPVSLICISSNAFTIVTHGHDSFH